MDISKNKISLAVAQLSVPIFLSGMISSGVIAEEEFSELTLEEIIVMARKREESIQDIPVTVSVISSDKLGRYNLTKPVDVASRVPTLTISTGGPGAGGRVDLRGVGSSAISPVFESAVAFNIDGVMVSNSRLVQNSYLDLVQVEVLKGPQSLYFGKSASAGVISFLSKDPTDEFEASISTSYEFEEGGYAYEGIISGPLADTLKGRLAVRYTDIDEVVKNIAPTATDKSRGEEDLNTRLTLVWEPSESFTANAKISYSQYEFDGANQHVAHNCVDGTPQDSAWPPGLAAVGITVPGGYDCDIDSDEYYLPDGSPVETAVFGGSNNGVPYTELDTFSVRLKLDYDISDTLSLVSVTSYLDVEQEDYEVYLFDDLGGASQNARRPFDSLA